MFRIKAVQTPSLREAVAVTIGIILLMSISIIRYGAPPHISLLISLLFLIVYGLLKGVSFRELENGITEGAKAGMAAAFLFFFIGILIASWMVGGTIPTLIYVGFSLVTPKFYLAVVFAVTAIVGVSIG